MGLGAAQFVYFVLLAVAATLIGLALLIGQRTSAAIVGILLLVVLIVLIVTGVLPEPGRLFSS